MAGVSMTKAKNYVSVGVAAGFVLGLMLGVSLGNRPLWIATGTILGFVIGLELNRRDRISN
jgi:hypothetical protein